MIVNLTVRPPEGEARSFEFHRAHITVGAGSKNDLVIASPNEVVRVLELDASGSGVRVTSRNADEVIRIVLPNADERREPDPNLLLPVGSRILVGEVPTEISIDRVRRPEVVNSRPVVQFTRSSPEEFVADLPLAVKDRSLRFAYTVGGQDSPLRFVAEFEAALGEAEGATVTAVELILPADGDEAWAVPSIFGSGDPALTIESLGVETGELHRMLCRSEIVVSSLRGSEVILVPYAVGSRLRAIVAMRFQGDAFATVSAVEDHLIAARPLVESFASRYARSNEVAAIEEENRYFKDRQRRHYLFKELASDSVAMRRLHRNLGDLVSTTAPVLLAGEAGTGKELLARALHHLGPRAGGIMVSQHCAALEEDALDFEIFGYARRGDGTSVASRRGVFELADGGTVFLDEVHALSPRLQMKVHRMLIEGEVFRIGESFARSVDLRVVASTHLDLMQLADEGRFRRDLAILLARNVLDVPALRDRREDIAPLVKSFVAKWSRRYRKSVENVDPDTLAWLQKLRWPGNVRELLTVIERAVLQAGPDQLTLQRTDFELR
jgi:DNA-binding NtrC family response regulator